VDAAVRQLAQLVEVTSGGQQVDQTLRTRAVAVLRALP
jgi:hypothetical protein